MLLFKDELLWCDKGYGYTPWFVGYDKPTEEF
jgi:hypothetical protein